MGDDATLMLVVRRVILVVRGARHVSCKANSNFEMLSIEGGVLVWQFKKTERNHPKVSES